MNSEDLEILKWILGQAYRSERRKARLDNRLQRLREEIEGPPGGRGYSPMLLFSILYDIKTPIFPSN